MARVRVMYWKEVPVQVQAEDENGKVTRQLDTRFQEAADAIAMFDGSAGTDAYLDGWGYGPFTDVDGPAAQAADRLADRLNRDMPEDFVARIRDAERAGTRDARPGAINNWAGL